MNTNYPIHWAIGLGQGQLTLVPVQKRQGGFRVHMEWNAGSPERVEVNSIPRPVVELHPWGYVGT